MRNVGGIRVTGGSYPARIWQAYMGPALRDEDPLGFLAPPEAPKGVYLHIEGEPDRRPTHRAATTTTSTPADGGDTGTDPGGRRGKTPKSGEG